MPLKVDLKLDGFVGRFFFEPRGLALVSTLSPGGVPNLAPKTQVMPIGRGNYWAFACCARHHTYQNVQAEGEFVINLPGPELIRQAALAAVDVPPGADEIAAAGLTAMPSRALRAPSVAECRVSLECRLHQVPDGFGEESLIVGRVVAAVADEAFASTDPAVLERCPLLVYVHPDYYAAVGRAERFRFPKGYKR